MGLTGLALAYMKASFMGEIFKLIGISLTYISSFIFAFFAVVYMIKILKYSEEVKKEFYHPIKLSFFLTISISLLLLSIAYSEINDNVKSFL